MPPSGGNVGSSTLKPGTIVVFCNVEKRGYERFNGQLGKVIEWDNERKLWRADLKLTMVREPDALALTQGLWVRPSMLRAVERDELDLLEPGYYLRPGTGSLAKPLRRKSVSCVGSLTWHQYQYHVVWRGVRL